MATPNELADIILAIDERPNTEWKKVPFNVCSPRLGNFVQKRPRNFFIRLVPLFEKYSYQLDNENLKDFLIKVTGKPFYLETISEEKTIPKTTVTSDGDFSPSLTSGEGRLSLEASCTSGTRTDVPTRRFKFTYIKRDSLEKQLNKWSLNMESDYIKDMKKGNVIPCIVNELCEAIKPTDEADGLATSTKRWKVEGSANYNPISMPKPSTMRLVHETSNNKNACVIGPVLYKALPLEVHNNGFIRSTTHSKGFLDISYISGGGLGGLRRKFTYGSDEEAEPISENPVPTLQSSFREIEKLLSHIVHIENIANAFRCLNSDEIQHLCRVFEKQEHMFEDLDIPDASSMSTNCRDILLFSGFESQKPGTLTLKKTVMVAPPETLKASYYLSVLLFETPGDMLKYLKASTVNLFPLLRDALLLKYRGGDVEVRGSDAVLSCPDAMNLLKSLDIGIKGSSVVSFPKSRECLATVVWVAMLYGGQCNAVQ